MDNLREKREKGADHRYFTRLKREKMAEIFNRRFPQFPELPKIKKKETTNKQKLASMETLQHLLSSRSHNNKTRLFERSESLVGRETKQEDKASHSAGKKISLPPAFVGAKLKFSKQLTGGSSHKIAQKEDRGFFSARVSSALSSRSRSITPSPPKLSKAGSVIPEPMFIPGESVYSELFTANFFDETISKNELRLMAEIDTMKEIIDIEQKEVEFLTMALEEREGETETILNAEKLVTLANLNNIFSTNRAVIEEENKFAMKNHLLSIQHRLIKLLTEENAQYDLMFQKNVENLLIESKLRIETLNSKWSGRDRAVQGNIRKPSFVIKPFFTVGNASPNKNVIIEVAKKAEIHADNRNVNVIEKKEESSVEKKEESSIESPKSPPLHELRKAYAIKIEPCEKKEVQQPIEPQEENKSVDFNHSENQSQLCSIRLRQNTNIPDSLHPHVDRNFI